jgi:hypothetical protein
VAYLIRVVSEQPLLRCQKPQKLTEFGRGESGSNQSPIDRRYNKLVLVPRKVKRGLPFFFFFLNIQNSCGKNKRGCAAPSLGTSIREQDPRWMKTLT